MRFLLSHYKKYTKELYGLFSYCYQRRRFVPDTEIWAYIKHNELPIHAAHIRMLERLISFKSFAHIRPSYIYFGMETYDQAEGVDYALEHASDIVSKDSILEAQQLLNYLQHRIATINK
ncbi:hypothetical protein KA013_01800 [Patescibacteria group bacterium]|nr:hypothetical protein [Patescibacteria group bacterium]